MPEQRLDIRVAAIDEASGVFARIGRNVDAINAKMSDRESGFNRLGRSVQTLYRLEIAVRAARTAFEAINGAMAVTAARTAEAAGRFDVAARKYQEFADSIGRIPIFGQIAGPAANAIDRFVYGNSAPEIMADTEASEQARQRMLQQQLGRRQMLARMQQDLESERAQQAIAGAEGLQRELLRLEVDLNKRRREIFAQARQVFAVSFSPQQKEEAKQAYHAAWNQAYEAFLQAFNAAVREDNLKKSEVEHQQFMDRLTRSLEFWEKTDREQQDIAIDLLSTIDPQAGRRAMAASRYEGLARQLQQQMRDKDASPEMIMRAQMLQSLIPEAIAAELRGDNAGSRAPVGLASLVESRFLTGVAQASVDAQQRQKNDEMLKQTQEQTALAKRLESLVTELVSLYKTLPPVGVASLN